MVRKEIEHRELIALIPARAISQRVENKNFKLFCGLPLFMYSLLNALMAKCFDTIIISSDNIDGIKEIVKNMNVTKIENKTIIFRNRPEKYATNESPDSEWIQDIFNTYGWDICDYYMILRPTNPFRTHGTIMRVWNYFCSRKEKNIALRTVSLSAQRPEKSWMINPENDLQMLPFFGRQSFSQKRSYGWECQTSIFPPLYTQNGCIDICPVSIIKNDNCHYIGKTIYSFILSPLESFNIDTPFDFMIGELLYQAIVAKRKDTFHLADFEFFQTRKMNEKLH